MCELKLLDVDDALEQSLVLEKNHQQKRWLWRTIRCRRMKIHYSNAWKGWGWGKPYPCSSVCYHVKVIWFEQFLEYISFFFFCENKMPSQLNKFNVVLFITAVLVQSFLFYICLLSVSSDYFWMVNVFNIFNVFIVKKGTMFKWN